MLKKISETTPTMASIVDGYGTSTKDGYSQRYINDANSYDTAEINTGKKWIDGKPIYRKVFQLETAILVGNSWTNIINISGLYLDNIINLTTLSSNGISWSGTLSRYSNNYLQLYNLGISGTDWYVKTLILEYTKLTD